MHTAAEYCSIYVCDHPANACRYFLNTKTASDMHLHRTKCSMIKNVLYLLGTGTYFCGCDPFV